MKNLHCLAGHPIAAGHLGHRRTGDDLHDGAAVTGDGLRYRIVYLAPELIRIALGGRPLPFVAGPVQALTPATRCISRFLVHIDEPVSDPGTPQSRSCGLEQLECPLRVAGVVPVGGSDVVVSVQVQEADGEAAQRCHHPWCVSRPDQGLVFLVGHVADPVN